MVIIQAALDTAAVKVCIESKQMIVHHSENYLSFWVGALGLVVKGGDVEQCLMKVTKNKSCLFVCLFVCFSVWVSVYDAVYLVFIQSD